MATDKTIGRSPAQDDIMGLLRYRDLVKKETRMMQLYRTRSAAKGGAEFVLNPTSLKPVTRPVGWASDRRVSPAQTLAMEADIEQLKSTIAKTRRIPTERNAWPETASQEIGWFHQKYYDVISRPYRKATHKVSEEAAFATTYVKIQKAGPFDKTQPLGR